MIRELWSVVTSKTKVSDYYFRKTSKLRMDPALVPDFGRRYLKNEKRFFKNNLETVFWGPNSIIRNQLVKTLQLTFNCNVVLLATPSGHPTPYSKSFIGLSELAILFSELSSVEKITEEEISVICRLIIAGSGTWLYGNIFPNFPACRSCLTNQLFLKGKWLPDGYFPSHSHVNSLKFRVYYGEKYQKMVINQPKWNDW